MDLKEITCDPPIRHNWTKPAAQGDPCQCGALGWSEAMFGQWRPPLARVFRDSARRDAQAAGEGSEEGE